MHLSCNWGAYGANWRGCLRVVSLLTGRRGAVGCHKSVYSPSPGDGQSGKDPGLDGCLTLAYMHPTVISFSKQRLWPLISQPVAAGIVVEMSMQALGSHTLLGINSAIASPNFRASLQRWSRTFKSVIHCGSFSFSLAGELVISETDQAQTQCIPGLTANLWYVRLSY